VKAVPLFFGGTHVSRSPSRWLRQWKKPQSAIGDHLQIRLSHVNPGNSFGNASSLPLHATFGLQAPEFAPHPEPVFAVSRGETCRIPVVGVLALARYIYNRSLASPRADPIDHSIDDSSDRSATSASHLKLTPELPT